MSEPNNGTPYIEQLKDPRWTALRDRILQRDWHRCVQCRTGGELNVHHSHYRAGRRPWEYRDADLFTLCKRCHEKIHGLPPLTPGEPPARGADRHSLQAERARWRADELQESREERIVKARRQVEELQEKVKGASVGASVELFDQVVVAKRELERLSAETVTRRIR